MPGTDRFGPLTERPFRLLWIARTGSSLGDALVVVAIPFAVLRIGGSATGLGVVLAAYTLGRAAFVMAGGVWADRLPRRAVMIGADLIRFGTQAATAALLFAHALQVWELAALQATAGAAGGFFVPASTALLPRTISAGRLQQANALISLSQSATNIFGPALSGAIVATAGPAWVFAIDAGTFLFSVAFLFALRVADRLAAARKRFLHDLADGWHEVRRVRWLTAGFLGFALGNVGIGMYLVLGPLVAREHLGGAAAWGVILTAGAIGGVVGGLFAYRFRPQRPVGYGIRRLVAGHRARGRADSAAARSRDHGRERALQRGGHRRQHSLGDLDAARGEARPARACGLDRLDALALPDARRPGARRTAHGPAGRSRDAPTCCGADVPPEPGRGGVRARRA